MELQQHTHFPILTKRHRHAFSSVHQSLSDGKGRPDTTGADDSTDAPHSPTQRNRDLGTIFHSLSGDWHVRRVIHHHGLAANAVDGRFDGTATFLPRTPSTEAPEAGTEEYLYREYGTFCTATGTSFPAQMKYIYQYHPSSNRLSVWRVKSGASASLPDEGEVDNWFHDITLEPPSGADGLAWFSGYQGAGDCVAKGSEHLCVRDTYKPYYRFCFRGDKVSEFGIGYDVSGPEKAYVSEGWFERT
ncbi:hypothetical protein SCP_0508220 [Sparassis crispa]|uniref:DUF6314 domain-containing protein n=1 Tax=Sparassis crispa TaxID=139825 RepID=A0A401GNH9_9APHY|nr:hypothetical protein SCP_0508220 [Sparassis crispa]GBE83766.1 hypothetical protein SCP_0508220 [Sparassis crispa]